MINSLEVISTKVLITSIRKSSQFFSEMAEIFVDDIKAPDLASNCTVEIWGRYIDHQMVQVMFK